LPLADECVSLSQAAKTNPVIPATAATANVTSAFRVLLLKLMNHPSSEDGELLTNEETSVLSAPRRYQRIDRELAGETAALLRYDTEREA
jgi:hypothetical protein